MASRSERQKQKKREKKRLRDQQRQQAARRLRRTSRTRNIDRLAALPLGECFASECWHEQGPPSVWAAVSRVHPNGRCVAGIVHLDLREQGVVSAEMHPELLPGQFEGRLGQCAGDVGVLSCDATLVAALIDAAQQMNPGAAHPAALKEVLALLQGVDPADCPHDIWTGPPAETPTKKSSKGLLSRMQEWLGQ